MKRLIHHEFLLLTVLLILFLLIYAFKIETIPSGMHGDEAETALEAAKVAQGAYNNNLSGFGWFDIPIPAFFLHALFFKIFGPSLFIARITTSSVAVLTLIPFYFLVKESFKRTVAFLSTVLLGFSHFWLALGRMAVFNNQAVLAEILVFYFLLRSLKEQKVVYFLLTGFFLGIGCYLYINFRITFFIITPLIIIQLLRKNFYYLIIPFIALITALPLIINYISNPTIFFNYRSETIIFSKAAQGHLLDIYKTNDLSKIIVLQTVNSIVTFLKNGDSSGFYGYKGSLLDSISLFFFSLGLIISLLNIRKFPYQLFLLWFFLTFIIGGVFTVDPLSIPRLLGLIPAMALLTAVGMTAFLRKLPITLFSLYTLRQLLMVIVLTIIISINLDIYFLEGPRQGYGENIATDIAKYINAFPKDYKFYFLTAPWFYPDFAPLRFLSADTKRFNINPQTFAASKTESKSVFIVSPSYENKLIELKNLNPQGKKEIITTPSKRGLIYAFVID